MTLTDHMTEQRPVAVRDATQQMRDALREASRRSNRGTKEGFREGLALLDLAARITPEGARALRGLIR